MKIQWNLELSVSCDFIGYEIHMIFCLTVWKSYEYWRSTGPHENDPINTLHKHYQLPVDLITLGVCARARVYAGLLGGALRLWC